MAVLPFPKATTFDDDEPGMDTGKVTITIDDDGVTTLDIPSKSKPRKVRGAKLNPKDFHRNLAEDIDPTSLASVAAFLIEGIESDIQDRSQWEETANKTAKYLGVQLNDPASDVSSDGTVSKMVSTAMLKAATRMWGTSYAELLPSGGPVKTKREDTIQAPPLPPQAGTGIAPPDADAEPGQDPQDAGDAAGDDLADALERDLNWYLTIKDRGYYPDYSKMLMHRNLIGVQFREIYRCPIKRMPVSRWIMAQDFIVQGDPAELTEGGRVTVRKKVRQSTMRRMMMSGEYLDIGLTAPTGRTSETELVIGETQGIAPTPSLPRDYEHEVYECYCELGSGTSHDLYGALDVLDLDETGEDVGYPLPYRVSIDVDSRTVLAIRRNWKQGDADHRVRRRFVKYGFIPGFGFYDYGLIHLVGNPTLGATMLQRSGIDASMFANIPAWMIMSGPGSRFENTVLRPQPGEITKIAVGNGAKLSDIVMPWPYKDASPQSMALVQKLEKDVADLAGIIEIPVGEGRIGNTPVGTIMSYIESVSQVPGAVHKADHVAQAEEFELLRELIAEEPEVLWRGNRSPARKWQVSQEVLSPDLSPQADPNTPSQIHRLLKVQGQIMLGGLPQFQGIADNRAIYKHATEILVGEDAASYTMPEQAAAPAAPDPRIEAAKIKAEADQQKGQMSIQEAEIAHEGKMAELAVQSSDKAADRDATNQREMMKVGVTKTKVGADMATAAVGHAQDQQSQQTEHAHQAATQSAEHVQQLTAPLLAPEGDKNA